MDITMHRRVVSAAPTRRQLIGGAIAGSAALALPFPALAASGEWRLAIRNVHTIPLSFARADTAVTIGIVYVGPRDDFGWNQAHAVAVKALKEVPGVTVVEEENVPETDAVSKSMESMINIDGANLILATSFGYYKPFVVDMAKKYPDTQFRHAAPLWNKDA
eukprot:gene1705-biopygen1475